MQKCLKEHHKKIHMNWCPSQELIENQQKIKLNYEYHKTPKLSIRITGKKDTQGEGEPWWLSFRMMVHVKVKINEITGQVKFS